MSETTVVSGRGAAVMADPGITRTARRAFTIADVLMAAFVIGYVVIGMRGLLPRLALLPDDDGPLFYARAFKTPWLFAGDYPIGMPFSQLLTLKLATSVMIWAPAALWRWANIDPYVTTWLFTFTQAAAIGLGVYVLSLSMVRSRLVAALAVVFAYAASPWSWAPTNYAGERTWIFVPYPASFAISPVLLAFAGVLRGRHLVALVALGMAALIHPGLAVFACAVLGFYWLSEAARLRTVGPLRRMAGLAIVGAVAVGPALWAQASQTDRPLPLPELMAGFRHNQHIWPWGYHGQWEFALASTVVWLAIGVLAWRWRDRFAANVGRLWLAAIVAAVVLGMSQVAGAIFQVPVLLNLIGLRSWMWVALVSLPLVAHYWAAHLESGDPVAAAAVVLALALPLVTGEYAVFWPLVVCLAFVDLSQGRLSAMTLGGRGWLRGLFYVLAAAVLIGWVLIVVAVPLSGTWTSVLWGYGAVPARRIRLVVVGMAVVGACAAAAGRRTSLMHAATGRAGRSMTAGALIVAVYAAGTGWLDWRAAEAAANPQSSDAMAVDVQRWARDHTPAASVFLVPVNGWRAIAERRAVSPFTRENYAYFVPPSAKEWRDRIIAFYGISPARAEMRRGSGMALVERAYFWRFREADFIRFAARFGTTHLVLPVCYPVTAQVAFDLPLVYRNPCYAIYRLDGRVGTEK